MSTSSPQSQPSLPGIPDPDGGPRRRRVAIACQGGGSHTAFTAGALARFLQPDVLADHEIVALSGTSGGAICAAIAWTTLVERRPEDAADLLTAFWESNSARGWGERTVNSMMLWGSKVAEMVTVPALSPYLNPGALLSANHLRRLIDATVDLDAAQERAAASIDPPRLHLGAVEALRGRFTTFSSTHGRISTDAILASAAIPTLFRSVRIDGGVYWDGLFSQNPPIDVLHESEPDEIWVIQINPTQIEHEPVTIGDIATRRNELAGNLSLYQELGFIEQVSGWLADGKITSDSIGPTTVRILEMNRTEATREWGYNSKLNRDPEFLAELLQLGHRQAQRMVDAVSFEHAWDDEDLAPLLDRFAEGTEVSSSHRLAPLEPTADRERIRAFFDEFGLRIETSRKRVCQDRVRWTVHSVKDARIRARVHARFDEGRVTSFRVSEA